MTTVVINFHTLNIPWIDATQFVKKQNFDQEFMRIWDCAKFREKNYAHKA